MFKHHLAFLAALTLFHIAGCTANTQGQIAAHSSSSVSSAMVEREASLSGQNGVITVDGDVVEVKDGKVTVNGVSYGNVGPDAQIRYVIRGQTKELFVDGKRRLLQH